MMNNLDNIKEQLKAALAAHQPVLKPVIATPERYEVTGTIEALQGKKKVDGIYFASVVPKPKDVRFYFFPLYTHRDQLIDGLSEDLKKALKGKTCFHIKSLNDERIAEINQLVTSGVKLYQRDGLLAKK